MAKIKQTSRARESGVKAKTAPKAVKNKPNKLTAKELNTITSRLAPHISGERDDIKLIQSSDELNNMAKLEIEGIHLINPVKVIKGPGYDIERIPSYLPDGRHSDVPGFSIPHPFIFEAGGDDANNIKNYFDQYLLNPLDNSGKSMSMIIQDLDTSEVFRWNFLDFVPESYSQSINNLIRFRWVKKYLPNEDRRFTGLVIFPYRDGPDYDPNGQELSNNLETDKLVEISGVTTLYTQVEVNESNRKLTLTYRYNEGFGLLPWVKNFVLGIADKRAMSIIIEENGVEVSRRNYFEVFPIKYEQFAGFSLYAKLQTRVVIAFGYSEDAR